MTVHNDVDQIPVATRGPSRFQCRNYIGSQDTLVSYQSSKFGVDSSNESLEEVLEKPKYKACIHRFIINLMIKIMINPGTTLYLFLALVGMVLYLIASFSILFYLQRKLINDLEELQISLAAFRQIILVAINAEPHK